MIQIARHVNGISLNMDLEFLLDDQGNQLEFSSPGEALRHLQSKGLTFNECEFFYAYEPTTQHAVFLVNTEEEWDRALAGGESDERSVPRG